MAKIIIAVSFLLSIDVKEKGAKLAPESRRENFDPLLEYPLFRPNDRAVSSTIFLV
jgi:hypothetical protein